MKNEKRMVEAWAWRPVGLAAVVMTGLLPIAAEAQRRCDAEDRVGWIGIAGIECSNCTITFPGSGRPSRFTTEPVITQIASGSPAAGSLHEGDVLVSVNGSLITTTEGAQKFSNLQPGQNLVLIVRRNGQHLVRRFESLPGKCPGDPLVIGSGAPRDTPLPTAQREVGPRGVAPRRPAATPVPPTGQTPRVAPAPPYGFGPSVFQQPRASFGFGIACSDCMLLRQRGSDRESPVIWEFASPPEVYSVEPNGPAYRAGLRRGDLITHINGTPITRDEAGRRFATAEPGQTLRFTYRRGDESRTVSVRAEPRAEVVRSQEAGSALRRARQLIEEMNRRERTDQLRLARELERLKQADQTATLEAVERYLREQEEQRERLAAVQEQLQAAETRLRRETVTTAPRTQRPPVMSISPGSSRAPLRYAGRLADTDIEIRGGPNVNVHEMGGDEIIITLGETVIRLRRR